MSCHGSVGDHKSHKLFGEISTAKNNLRRIKEGSNFTSTTGDYLDKIGKT